MTFACQQHTTPPTITYHATEALAQKVADACSETCVVFEVDES
jgi:hypothetical protein